MNGGASRRAPRGRRRRGGRAGAVHATGDQGGRPDIAANAVVSKHLGLDLPRHVDMIAQELLGVLTPLPDPVPLESEPGPGLLDHATLGAEIDEVTLVADTFTVEDVELHLPERRRHLVLHDLDARAVADDLLAVLEGPDPPDVETHACVELERVSPGGGLGVAEHDPDLHADLVDEDHERV